MDLLKEPRTIVSGKRSSACGEKEQGPLTFVRGSLVVGLLGTREVPSPLPLSRGGEGCPEVVPAYESGGSC